MSVARCRFWKAIFFELLDQLLSPFISFFDSLFLNNAVENSTQLQGIRYFVACRNTTLNRFVFITIISPTSMKTNMTVHEKFIVQIEDEEINNPREDCLITELLSRSRCFDT